MNETYVDEENSFYKDWKKRKELEEYNSYMEEYEKVKKKAMEYWDYRFADNTNLSNREIWVEGFIQGYFYK